MGFRGGQGMEYDIISLSKITKVINCISK